MDAARTDFGSTSLPTATSPPLPFTFKSLLQTNHAASGHGSARCTSYQAIFPSFVLD